MRKCLGRNKKSFDDVLDILSDAHQDNIQDTNNTSKNAVKKAKQLAKQHEKSMKKVLRLLKKDKHHEHIGKSIKILINQDLGQVTNIFNSLKPDHRDLVLKKVGQVLNFDFIKSILEFLTNDEKKFVFNKALKADKFNIANLFSSDLDINEFNFKEFSEQAISYLLKQGFEVAVKSLKFEEYNPTFVKELSNHNIKVDLNNCIQLLFDRVLYKSVKSQLTVDHLKNIFKQNIDIFNIDQAHLRDILANVSGKSLNNEKLLQTIFNYAVDLGIEGLKELLKKEYGKYIQY